MTAAQQMLWALSTIGYLILSVQLWRTGSFWRTPFFFFYCCTLTAYYTIWPLMSFVQGISTEIILLFQPTLLALRISVAIEIFILLSVYSIGKREMRALLLFAVLVSALVTLTAYDYFPAGRWVDLYRRVHQTTNVALAICCFVTGFYFWAYPPFVERRVKAHASIFALLSLAHAVTGFAKTAGWQTANAWFFAVSILCVALWLWRGMLAKPADPRLHVPHSIV